MLGVDERDLDAADIDGAALVAADQGVAFDALGSQPARDLEVADDLGLGRLSNLERVVDVVEMTVRDEHEVTLVYLLQGLGRHRVAHDPGVDDDVLRLGAADLPGAVTDPREADMSVERQFVILPIIRPSGRADSPTAPKRRSRSRRASRGSERRGRTAAVRIRAGRHRAAPEWAPAFARGPGPRAEGSMAATAATGTATLR